MVKILFLVAGIWIVTPGINWAQTSVKTEKLGKTTHSFSKVLIVALNKMYENRKTVEAELTWWISDQGYNAFPYQRFNNSIELPSRNN
jgi:hypothetical protein